MQQSDRMTAPLRRGHGWLRVVLGVALMSLVLSSVAISPAHAASTRPAFQMPFPCGEGWTASTRSGHPATDWNFGAGYDDYGKPVAAAAAGIATVHWQSEYGYYVDVDHGGGWVTRYAHMLADDRVEGPVAQGEIIGHVGSSGSSTSAHLHWEQRADGVAQYYLYADGNRVLGDGRSYISRNCMRRNPLLSGDVDGDGDDDLVARFVHADGSSTVKLLRGRARSELRAVTARQLSESTLPPTAVLALADTDGDRRADLNGLYRRDGGVQIASFGGRSDGTFGARTLRGFHGAWKFDQLKTLRHGDVNGDGIDDLVARFVVADGGTRVRLIRGARADKLPTFGALRATAAVMPRTSHIALGDTTGDGRDDMNLVTGHSGTTEIVTYPSTGTAFGDRLVRYRSQRWSARRVRFFGSGSLDGNRVDDLVLRLVQSDGSSAFKTVVGQRQRTLSATSARDVTASALSPESFLAIGDTNADGRADLNAAFRRKGVQISTFPSNRDATLARRVDRYHRHSWGYHRLG
jgi:hypothetical protein